MSDHSNHREDPAPAAPNMPVYSVSEISRAIKRTIEDDFAWVRVRGEISGFKRAASGHLYMTLKDRDAVIDGVCWRGKAGRLSIAPEDGMEVIVSGRVTTFAGRSKYQLVIEQMELAGEGALLKLLEERKRKLAAEGLFEEARKRPLPYLPDVIGVVTSPTGAVIRDILHRLAARFPRRVLVWPVLVQGEAAAAQVAAAIEGFNGLKAGGPVPRPDLLIVARGGGSLEDLWAFNEEVVVRAAAASEIPLISAVGHETDVTLIDFAADRRAPTPSAAAEMAVPVRADLVSQVLDGERRLRLAWERSLSGRRTVIEGLGRGLPHPARLLEDKSQRLDDRIERFESAVRRLFVQRQERTADLAARLPHPRRQLALARERFAETRQRFDAAFTRRGALERKREALAALGRVLETVSYQSTLARGFAVVHGPKGVVTRAAQIEAGESLKLQFSDGQAAATAGPPSSAQSARPKPPRGGGEQGKLL